jgi:hypothetical protein
MTTDGADRSFGAPRFDVVLRGYDRRQVDEHLSRLQRVLSRMRGDLEAARGQSGSGGSSQAPTPPGGRPRPTPRPRPDTPAEGGAPDVVGTFTDRMQTILQAAEDEAAEIRAKARSAVRSEEERLATMRAAVRSEEETARITLTNLLRQRDAVLADLTRVRGQLEALLSGPTARIAVPVQDGTAARRDAGAGHPLPGTPGSEPSGPEARVLAARSVEPPQSARPAVPTRTATPPATTPKATTPKATTPKATTPQTTTPRAATPPAATTPKAPAPPAAAPAAAMPEATAPKAATLPDLGPSGATARGPAGSSVQRPVDPLARPRDGVWAVEQTMEMAPPSRPDAVTGAPGVPDEGSTKSDPPVGDAPAASGGATAASGRPADGSATDDSATDKSAEDDSAAGDSTAGPGTADVSTVDAPGGTDRDRPGNERDRVSNTR